MFVDLVTTVAFCVTGLVVFAVIQWMASQGGAADEGDGGTTREASGFARAMAGVVPQPASEIENIQRDLKKAGYYRSTALTEYLATRNSLVVLLLIVTLSMALMAEPGTPLPQLVLLVGAILAALSYAVPRMILSRKAKNRVGRIERGLPDALDLIRMCLTGGLPLRDAMERVSGELRMSHPDVATEFDIMRRQADANSMSKALRNFAERIDVPDARALSALVSQTERMGTHVAAAVAEFADGVRQTYRQRAEERASKTSIALLFPVVFCLMPPILILMAGPPVLRLRNFLIEENAPGGVLDLNAAANISPVPQGNGQAGGGATLIEIQQ